LLWGLPGVAQEVRAWHTRAQAIPDRLLRNDALDMLGRSRANADGAALFFTLARRRDRRLLQVLVAYELMADFLDSVSERGACAGVLNGCQLHLAMADALEPDHAMRDYYKYNPSHENSGYLQLLLAACREGFASLPAYARVRPLALEAAGMAEVQGLNHESNPIQRDALLEHWAGRRFPQDIGLSWFELTGAASAWLGVLALLALAAELTVGESDGLRTSASYLWISLAGTMLDSFGDMEEDAAQGAHSYIGHYPSTDIAAKRLCELLRRATADARELHNGHRHSVIVACMVAMYLSKDSTRSPHMREHTASLVRAGGPLARALVPVLRIWRIAYGQQSA
jgi:tetraprenyl-beta-curcumene synthase